MGHVLLDEIHFIMSFPSKAYGDIIGMDRHDTPQRTPNITWDQLLGAAGVLKGSSTPAKLKQSPLGLLGG